LRLAGSGRIAVEAKESDPDRALVERARSELPYGTSAFNQLVRRHSDRVYTRCYRILRSEADAEEAVQDVFLAVFRSLGRYRYEKPFQHWLSVITLNTCRMILRKRAGEARRRAALQERMPAAPPQEQADVPLRALLLELLDDLDPGTRVPMLMKFVEGYTFGEIAADLGLSESAVKMRVSRGAKTLRKLYERRTRHRPDPGKVE